MSNPIPLSVNSCSMQTTYKKGDRVITKVEGTEVKATVQKVTVDIEVRTDDGRTWWRALSRLRPAVGDATTGTDATKDGQPVHSVMDTSCSIKPPVELSREEHTGEAAKAPEAQEMNGSAQPAHTEPETAATDKSKRRNRKQKR